MSNPLHLTPGQKYRVIKAFTDYDKEVHPIGETWVFADTNFAPYDSGLSVNVTSLEGKPTGFRMQWTDDEQGKIIEDFQNYVELVPGGGGGRAPSQ